MASYSLLFTFLKTEIVTISDFTIKINLASAPPLPYTAEQTTNTLINFVFISIRKILIFIVNLQI